MQISAYSYPDYGILKGAVRAISADIITPQTTSAAVPCYEVTIQPERPYLIKGDRSYPLKSGMEVTADIISQEETLLKFVLRKARLLTNLCIDAVDADIEQVRLAGLNLSSGYLLE